MPQCVNLALRGPAQAQRQMRDPRNEGIKRDGKENLDQQHESSKEE